MTRRTPILPLTSMDRPKDIREWAFDIQHGIVTCRHSMPLIEPCFECSFVYAMSQAQRGEYVNLTSPSRGERVINGRVA